MDTDKTSEEELIHIVKSDLGRQAVADAVASTQV